MANWKTQAELDSVYPAHRWREAFHVLEPVVGRSVSEVMIEDLCGKGVDINTDNSYVRVADVKRVLDWLFGEGGDALLDYLERYLKLAEKA